MADEKPAPLAHAATPGASPGVVVLPPRAAKIGRRGHPWFYADDFGGAELPDRSLVRVLAPGGRDLGLGFTSAHSKIALRLAGRWPGEGVPAPAEFLAARLTAAVSLRAGLGIVDGPRAGARLVHGEADELPGLVIDRYADICVVQSTAAFIEAHLDTITEWLGEHLAPRMVLLRGDLPVREREGLSAEVRVLTGERIERVEIEEDGVRHPVLPFEGQKTGFYLDQRPARARVRSLARGARVLDVFSYQGAFSLAALAGGAREATAVDQSLPALERAADAAEAQRLGPLRLVQGNAFDALRELRDRGERYDLVILDPPPFAKSRRELDGALRGYRDLNRLALRLLEPGGRLLTASCSHHLTPELFEDVLRQASFDLPFRVFLEERLGAGPDHPVWLRLPESEYLKVRVLRRVE